MDEYFDQFLASTSWSDPNVKDSPFWICNEADQLNGYGLLPNSVGSYESDIEISAASLIGSNHTTVESFTSQESSTVITGAPHHPHVSSCSLNGVVNNPSNFGYMGMPLNTTKSTLSPLNLGAANELLSYEHDVKARCYGFETLPPNPHLWNSPSYEGVGSLPPMGNGNLQGVALQGVYGERDIYGLGNKYVQDVVAPQPENLSANVPMKGNEKWRNHHLSSLVLQPQRTMTVDGLQSPSQTASVPPSGNCNGNGKPRVRARRGQATDPHSIAERHRREKIADGMKNLQELVPDSNKTDKASMLDEIIDYVKFLQLQVKVLSMSRLGAAEAVVPLVEGSNGLLLTPTKNKKLDSNPSCEQTAMEREVVKLMESNITMAIQYLQKKGLCLMPIALASALSNGKKQSSSSSCCVSEERSDSHSSCNNVTCIGSVLNMEDLKNNGSQAAQEVRPQI